jgi:DNA adenine methylase Dam
MFVETPFNFTGSKFKLLSQLVPLFDYTKPYFVDVFCGGGSVYTNVVDKYEKVLVNDIISDLIGIHKGLIESDEIIERTKSLCLNLKGNQDEYLNLRKSYNQHGTPDKLWALMLSCNSNLIRFNQKGEFNQTWGKRSFNNSTEKKVKSFTEHIRKFRERLIYESLDFSLLEVSKDTFYYIDPPYGYVKNENGDIGNKQISEAGYNNFYYRENDIKLYEFCNKINEIGSTFVISGVLEHGGNTSWILDKLISDGFSFKVLDFNYEKINKTSSKKNTKEIIVKNF